MASIVDDRGFNQGFKWNKTQEVRIRRRAQGIVRSASLVAGDQVLELGCGTGELAHFIADETPASVTGVDICEPFVEQANKTFGRERLKYVVADLSRTDEIDRLGAHWAMVAGNGILHHLYHVIDTALPRFRRLLRPGGQFTFWEPNLFNPYVYAIFSFGPLRKVARLEPEEMAFTAGWAEQHLEKAGFVDIQVSYRDFLVPNLPWALVPAVTAVGDVLERVPGVDRLAQSVFITARAP